MQNNQRNTCKKSGIKIHETTPNSNVNKLTNNYANSNNNDGNTILSELDLDLNNYLLEDIYRLFNIPVNQLLNEDILKKSKQIVLKMHPDKSRLEAKYFLFFSKAYKRLFAIYEFQNKSTNKTINQDDSYDETNKNILEHMFETNKKLKDPKEFNKWFNQSFEKHRIDDPMEEGHGKWLSSNDDFISVNEHVTKSNMNNIFEQKKKEIKDLIPYTGVQDLYSSNFGSSLDGNNSYTSDNYTDLRQAYSQTLIPVTMDDYNKTQQFNNVNDYKRHRDTTNVKPLTEQESLNMLHNKQQEQENASTALAFKYAQESERVKQKQNDFWSELKRLT